MVTVKGRLCVGYYDNDCFFPRTITEWNSTTQAEERRRYHGWMQCEELQQLTASEPLSLEQEFEMQESWFKDEDKCTFVILDRNVYSQGNGDEIASMIGDVNLFLNDIENRHTAEVEIMVAESHARGQGMGKEALVIMMRYGVEYLALTSITAKIGFSNEKSLNMFRKIGFKEISRSEVFKEVTLEWIVNTDTKQWLWDETKYIDISMTEGSNYDLSTQDV